RSPARRTSAPVTSQWMRVISPAILLFLVRRDPALLDRAHVGRHRSASFQLFLILSVSSFQWRGFGADLNTASLSAHFSPLSRKEPTSVLFTSRTPPTGTARKRREHRTRSPTECLAVHDK